MSQFNCPKCRATVTSQPSEVGCPACGFGRPHTHEQRPLPKEPQQVEAPPGYKGKYLTEVL